MKQKLIRNLFNIPGISTKRKIVVIESDDWGAVRMPSKMAYKYLTKKGIIQKDDPFLRYDTIASIRDLEHLFDSLKSVRDSNGDYAKITFNCVMANPDFHLIKKHDFLTYYYESIIDTFKRYPGCEDSFTLWKQGMENNLLFPQLHGREHVNFSFWLQQLQNNSEGYKEAFHCETYAVDHKVSAALAYFTEEQRSKVNETVLDGTKLFDSLFGYHSKSFIAPNYTWDKSVEKTLYKLGVKYLQGTKRQNVPQIERNKLLHKYHFMGQKNANGQYYLVRNCLFEPSISPNADNVGVCLRQIKNAFHWKKPAIISSHRLNYVGRLDERNRIENLNKFKKLLQNITKTWPDVEFLSTDQMTQELFEA